MEMSRFSTTELELAIALSEVEDAKAVRLGTFCIFVLRDCLPSMLGCGWAIARQRCNYYSDMWPALAYQESGAWQFLIPVHLLAPEVVDVNLDKVWPIDIIGNSETLESMKGFLPYPW